MHPVCCQVCERRGDEQAEIVRVCLEGAGADLHAADAKYHVTYYQTFTSESNINAVTRRPATSNTLASEEAVETDVSAVREQTQTECGVLWNCILHTRRKGKLTVTDPNL